MKLFDYHKSGYKNKDGTTTWTSAVFSIRNWHFWFRWKYLDDDQIGKDGWNGKYVRCFSTWLFITTNKNGVFRKKLNWWWNLYQWDAPKWKFWRHFQAVSNGVTFYRIG
jgi:hypothetical protein